MIPALTLGLALAATLGFALYCGYLGWGLWRSQ
jgi:hypothetical protein